MRNLASIQKVVGIAPIEGADAIEVATVLGWQCVVKKSDNLQVGDLCVYIEIDSICPALEPFLFLEQRKYRIKTIKLRGVVSQGLALPLSYFPQFKTVKEGDDVSDVLGIKKYDPEGEREQRQSKVCTEPNPLREFFMQFAWFRAIHRKLYPTSRRGWPSFFRKTDETRIQNYAAVIRDHASKLYYMTEKIDGQSASYFVTRHNGAWFGPKYTFGVCSRNIYLKTKHSCTWWNVAAQFDIENKLLSIGKDICIQGEIVGEGVQGNKYGLKGLDFYVFNVWDIATQSYYTYSDMVVLCNSLSLKTVPIINDRVTLPATIPEIVDMSKGKSVLNTKVHREGIVVRTMANMPNGEPVSFKCINPDFLLKFSDD